MWCLHTELIANADVLERAELLIAVRGNCAVALLPRTRRIGKMSRGAVERGARIAFDDGRGQFEARNLEQPNEIRTHCRILDGCFRRVERGFDGRTRFLLAVLRVNNRERIVANAGDTNNQERTFKQCHHHGCSLIT
jgi:hypothetical protein